MVFAPFHASQILVVAFSMIDHSFDAIISSAYAFPFANCSVFDRYNAALFASVVHHDWTILYAKVFTSSPFAYRL